MRYVVTLLFLAFVSGSTQALSYCANTHFLLPSVVRISNVGEGAIQGTAWFVDETHLVTIDHVAKYLVPNGAWAPLDIFQINPRAVPGQRTEQMKGRRAGTLRTYAGDDVTVIELDRPFPGARSVEIDESTPAVGDALVIIGFPKSMLRVGKGRYLGRALAVSNGVLHTVNTQRLDLEDTHHRGIFVEGASGSPIFDCHGRVIGVLNSYLVKSKRASCDANEDGCTNENNGASMVPPRGMATNYSVPVTGLGALLEVIRSSDGT